MPGTRGRNAWETTREERWSRSSGSRDERCVARLAATYVALWLLPVSLCRHPGCCLLSLCIDTPVATASSTPCTLTDESPAHKYHSRKRKLGVALRVAPTVAQQQLLQQLLNCGSDSSNPSRIIHYRVNTINAPIAALNAFPPRPQRHSLPLAPRPARPSSSLPGLPFVLAQHLADLLHIGIVWPELRLQDARHASS